MTQLGFWLSGILLVTLGAGSPLGGYGTPIRSDTRLEEPFVVTQLPAGASVEKQAPLAGGMLRGAFGEGARLVLVSPEGTARVLTAGMHSACDPAVSFDASRILFAGKRTASDRWSIFEMAIDGSGLRQITKDAKSIGDCRSPGYQSTLYILKPIGVPNQPEYHLTFVARGGSMNDCGASEATHLYACKLDGSSVRRLTFNLSDEMDPFLMDDGRLVFAGWQRARLEHGAWGRVALMGVNLDGSDYALFAGYQGRRIKQMPCATEGGLVVFVEADRLPWDGAGYLSCVQIRRPLHSYRPVTAEGDGLFHSPSPLPDGRVLVSRRPGDGSGTHGVWRLDPATGKRELVFDDPRYHEIQARLIHKRDEPDGRSSAVPEEADASETTGKFYCLNVYTSDLERSWLPPGTVKRLRVLEGVPVEAGGGSASREISQPAKRGGGGSTAAPTDAAPPVPLHGLPPLAPRRILGEIPVHDDGSFNIEVPANTPVELQALDADGMALRSCGWIWVRGRGRQGCIGCHEDGELVPENLFVGALAQPSIPLTLPPERRRTVDFRRHVMPIVAARCVPCHGQPGKTPLEISGELRPVPGPDGHARFNHAYHSLLARAEGAGGANGGSGLSAQPEAGPWGRYVHPGQARTSPLVWHLFGRNTSRPWDGPLAQQPVKLMPPAEAGPLSEDEKRTFVEWIDLGALWDASPQVLRPHSHQNNVAGETR